MKKTEAFIPGVCVLTPPVFQDNRGFFVKSYNKDSFQLLGLPFIPAEEFYSVSKRNVIRGMHFQNPPHDHDKLVLCLRGSILDVVVDLRTNSPAYKKFFSLQLTAASSDFLFIPKGVAHGFLSLEEDTLLYYAVSAGYSPSSDSGIHWNSFGFAWPVENPIVSLRDDSLCSVNSFQSSFIL